MYGSLALKDECINQSLYIGRNIQREYNSPLSREYVEELTHVIVGTSIICKLELRSADGHTTLNTPNLVGLLLGASGPGKAMLELQFKGWQT